MCAHYQPIVSLTTGAMVGCEALVRWQHPERGLLSPWAFLPALAAHDLEVALDWHLLGAVCAQVAAWGRVRDGRHLAINVNVDPRQFAAPDFVERWLAAVAGAGLPAEAVRPEVPREALDQPCTAAHLAALRAGGVGVYFDDARPEDAPLLREHGGGLVAVKLDHHLARDLVPGAAGHAPLRAIADQARAMGLALVAEAIEEEAQIAGALDLGCAVAQGYLFSKPLDAATLTARLAGHP